MSVFERSETDEFARGARALVIYPELPGRASVGPEARLAEAEGLALAIGLNVVQKKHFRVRSPRAVTLLGGGQVEEIAQIGRDSEIDLLIVDASLTAIQQRNLEERTGLKTIDRTGLILEIFGERAATAEGRLQVELAHLDYQAGRLVRSWTHLERQRGGFGFLGGPGETQIEADRRMIRDRMARLRRELEEVKRTRSLHRARRKRAPWPVIALVGYTNAGKSTLFNSLTRATVLAEDMLFATLDPTMREISLPGVEKAILSDTVGFVSDLPTQLVAAFRATLEEVISADIIVHVRDISHSETDAQRDDVLQILRDLGVLDGDDAVNQPRMLEVWNKIDLLDAEKREDLSALARRHDDVLMISAQTGEGVDAFKAHLSALIAKGNLVRSVRLKASDGAALAWLHARGTINSQIVDEDLVTVEASLSRQLWGQFDKQFAQIED
ncbi:MAG: GTPase HflX [Sphingomonadales bacterium 35-56-22]|uniref:GTPase HflX n=1 Tax=Sphingorhabdus sp. TaxID=1902408 RepID=UPI000BD7251A|nr:GTPase HflX [Sphingorhabdus sp.]OYY15477.1 MAG: GTPase HflX [Sphingomonadales bacterium 35-56-22]OYY98694.1 MAG: GTPase HflX [Sphingomonadales bacterium 28-56-43]OYZ61684.1 MAG: GTPase HflX [Sphingomonadales bacterium 24-56-14]OZA83899.1 MAG: GTPase HflX [Sphingomonadales bacterium 39-57-19]HQS11548.1 GTPase HflX [Sphingorhabdus sp.]